MFYNVCSVTYHQDNVGSQTFTSTTSSTEVKAVTSSATTSDKFKISMFKIQYFSQQNFQALVSGGMFFYYSFKEATT